MQKIPTLCLYFILIGFFSLPVWSWTNPGTADNSSTEWIQVDGHTLLLNGRGIYFILFFKIYEISLFLESPSSHSDEILNSSQRKVFHVKFFRNVERKDLQKGLIAGFNENCGDQCERLKNSLEMINNKIPDFNKGDSLEFHFLPSKLILRSNLARPMEIDDRDFNRILLSLWLGPNPPSKRLLNQLLGLRSISKGE